MVAKIKQRKLQWKASQSPQVVGYKLYWAQGEKVSYDSPCADLGRVTEVTLPDDVDAFTPATGPVEFGVTAVDESGNESDLVTVSAPHQFNAPSAPEEIWIEGPKDSSPQAPKEELSETESHISLLEHTIKGADQQKTDDENSGSSEAAGLGKMEKHFGIQ
ncbi:MAG: hypothetical protein P8X96_06695 [Desulfobacteraceae bacterium]